MLHHTCRGATFVPTSSCRVALAGRSPRRKRAWTSVITLHAILFHGIKGRVEGEQHTWITGFYWTLVVMTTTTP
jgi:hypothetical protein